ncbi:MAG: hypothetical protein ACREDI_05700, partial [Roseiarcus sp.]
MAAFDEMGIAFGETRPIPEICSVAFDATVRHKSGYWHHSGRQRRLNGVQFNGSIQTSTGTPANSGPDILNTSALSIINLTATTKSVTVVVSDTDFTGPVASFATAGARHVAGSDRLDDHHGLVRR